MIEPHQAYGRAQGVSAGTRIWDLEAQLDAARAQLATATADRAPRAVQDELPSACTGLTEQTRALADALTLLDRRLAAQRRVDTAAAVHRLQHLADELQQQYEAAVALCKALNRRLAAHPEFVE
jgi:hypothetical protein